MYGIPDAPYIRHAELFGMPESAPLTYCGCRHNCENEIYEGHTFYDFEGDIICEDCLDEYLTRTRRKRKANLQEHEIAGICAHETITGQCETEIGPKDTFYHFDKDLICMECLSDYLEDQEYAQIASAEDFIFD